MNAVVAARVHLAQEFHLVEHVVVLRGGDAVEAAGDFVLVVVHRNVEAVVEPQQPVGGADGGGDFLNCRRVERLAGRGRREAEQPTVLVTGDDAALAVGAKVDPRALLADGHGVEQLDLEILEHLDAFERGGFVLVDGLAGVGGGRFLGRLFLGRLGILREGRSEAKRESEGGEAEQMFHKRAGE